MSASDPPDARGARARIAWLWDRVECANHQKVASACQR
jgi:hypothetical protein